MENLKEEYFLWNYQKLTDLGKDTALVKDRQSGEISVCKHITGNEEVFKKLCGIKCRSLACVTNVFEFENGSYALLEYAPGKTIKSIIESGRLFSENETAFIVSELCDGLAVLHANGIIHRDVTAANVVISQSGEVKIIDYGIARLPRTDANKDTHILGTAGFAAPEQFGFAQSDERTDIYSLGVLINVMLTGEFPTDEICTGFFADTVKRCVSIEASKRFRSIDELKKSIFPKKKEKEQSIPPQKGIPGFRSKNPFAVAAAVVAYFLAIFSVFTAIGVSYHSGGIAYAAIETVNIVCTTFLPYVMIHNAFNSRERLPLLRKVPDYEKKGTVALASIGLIVAGFYIFTSLIQD